MWSRRSHASSCSEGRPLLKAPDLIVVASRRLRSSRRLRRSLLAWSVLGLVTTLPFAALVAAQHATGSVAPLTLAAAGWWLLVSVIFALGASMLTTPNGVVLDGYGVPNGLTAMRAWLCLPLLLCATLSLPGRLGLVLWAAIGGPVGFLDAVDGFVARRVGPVSVLGKALDPFIDSLFFSVAAAGSAILGILPLWLAALMGLRYLGPLLATPFVWLARRRPEIVHTVWGRRNTTLTGAVLFTLLLVRLIGGPVNTVALIVALPTLVPTMLLHFGALVRRTMTAPFAR